MTSTSTLNGFAAEFAAQRLFKSANLKRVAFRASSLLSILRSSSLGRDRLAKSQPYMLAEWMELDAVPAEVLLDYAYGIDAVINFRGYIIGIDITVNPSALTQKQRKLQQLKPLWSAAKIDCAVVLHIGPNTTAEDLVSALRQVIKSETVQAIAL